MAGENRHSNRVPLDPNSIKTTTLVSFVVFALLLISFLWTLMSFFINTYYEAARTQEVIRTAAAIETQYREDAGLFDEFALQTAGTNGIYIRLDSSQGSYAYDGTSGIRDSDTFDIESRGSARNSVNPVSTVSPKQDSAHRRIQTQGLYMLLISISTARWIRYIS